MPTKDKWAAISAWGSLVAALVACVTAGLSYCAIQATNNAASAAIQATNNAASATNRNEAIRDLDTGIERFKANSHDATYLILVLRNIAELQRAHLLTNEDVQFVSIYLTKDDALQYPSLCEAWKRVSGPAPSSEELRNLMKAALGPKIECTTTGK